MKMKRRIVVGAVVTGLMASVAQASACDIACQAVGVANAVACKATAAIVGGYATVAVPGAGVAVGMVVSTVNSLCDDWGVGVYEDCYDLFCSC